MRVCFHPSCSTIAHPADGQEILLSRSGYSVSIFTEFSNVPERYWLTAAASEDYFLSREYLQLLSEYKPDGMDFVYLLFCQNGVAVGIAYGQVVSFRADEHIRTVALSESWWKKSLARQLHFRLLVAGNLLLTGQHSYCFAPTVSEKLAAELVQEALQCVVKQARNKGSNIAGVLVKDLPADDSTSRLLQENGPFQSLTFQPNMVLSVRPEWDNFDDYLTELTSKYRVRYRRARKKARPITRHELSLSQIRAYEEEIYQLYLNIANEADFCMTYLHPNYFSELKARTAEGRFRLWGYFLNDRLIGFCTALWNGKDMEAHFLGMDQTQNAAHQLYLNMLYDLIQVGIAGQARQLIFSRTAMAIKSSVGAKAQEATVLIASPGRPLLQPFITPLVRLLEPSSNWEERHPFKAEEAIGNHIT